jgi:hypothetical protein
MRRPLPVKRKIRGSQGACPLTEHEAAPHARVARRPRATRDTARLAKGPLSLIPAVSSERWQSVKGAPFPRGLRTLDRLPPFRNIDAEGKGAGGLRGLAPWRSMRRRLMRAFRAPPPVASLPVLSPANSPRIAFCPLTPAPLSPCFHPHSGCDLRRRRCLLVFSIQGVLPSLCRSAGTQSPGSPRSAPTSQSPQLGAFAFCRNPILYSNP